MPVTLQKLQEQGIERLFGHEMLYYVYHKMNGREAEAQSYLDAYEAEQDQLKKDYEEGADQFEKFRQNMRMPTLEECKEEGPVGLEEMPNTIFINLGVEESKEE